MARSRGRAEPPMVVTDRHARGLVRKFLGDEQQRAAEVRRRRRRQPLRGAPSMRAAHRVLERLEKDWAPRTLASYTDVSPDGAARLGIACLETERGWLENWPGVAARSFVRRYLVRPGDTLYRSKWRGYAAFTQHCLERVMQRGLHLKSARWELGVASIIANPRLHELAISRGFKQVLVPGLTGVFVGDFEPELPFLRLDTFLAITAAGRRHCDLLVELAGLLWTGDRYRELMPALFYPDERNTLMDEVLRTYERHQRLLSRPHEPGEDWFGLAVAQKEDASARLVTIHV